MARRKEPRIPDALLDQLLAGADTGSDTSAASAVVSVMAGASAPVGQACTHSPHPTQLDTPIAVSKSNTIFDSAPRCA